MLDNDLYKFTMQQAVYSLYPDALTEYELTNRGDTLFPKGFAKILGEKIKEMAEMALTPEELAWLEKTCPYFTSDYLAYLSSYRYDPDQVLLTQKQGQLDVKIKGPWSDTILWEVPLMALICETYFAMTAPETLSRKAIRERNQDKAKKLADAGVFFVDFGTRRRYSATNHDHLIADILSFDGHTLAGTSNVHLAYKYNILPIGTLAHEWVMFHSALNDYTFANASAMDAWTKVYPEVLGIALTDTFTTDLFLKAFNRKRAGQFTGVRQDSGDPIEFTRKLVRHYKDKGIEPSSKSIVFSDGLDPDKAIEIHKFCKGKVKDAYGIGTNLTNDVGATPLNIVIKLSRTKPKEGQPWKSTVKLSDDPGKHTGNKAELSNCLKILGL